ncbi:DegT/DnrJ/EryC1/StrS family aminotransferase [bacterium]|nr:MAG: DegT/DnrJ/EryC1/StrS family aminotransferase [bacterium]
MTETTIRKIHLPSDQDASGRNLGQAEIAAVSEAIQSGTLTSTKGRFVKALEQRFAAMLGVKHAFACASGSAAVHCAVAAVDPEPGDEIITTAITDMGALAPIMYQTAIPVFADVDPRTCNVTAETIAPRISQRTKAIIVTHLFGNPCEMGPIVELARSAGIPIIEDCAQAFMARYDGHPVGTLGAIGAFSLQQGKHITTGEGGLVVTGDDALARRIFLFINKAWGYGDPQPDHYFLALNERMSELCGAVGVAQLDRLESVVGRRIALAAELDALLCGIPGVALPYVAPKSVHTYWKYCIRVDAQVVPDGVSGVARLLRDYDIFTVPRYIQKPAFACEVFQQHRTFGNSHFPFTLARPEALDYSRERFPGTFEALDGILVIPWNDRFTSDDVRFIAEAIRTSVATLRAGKS